MALCVDYNELRFLVLLVLMVAEICTESNDYNRGFYFFNQAVNYFFNSENCFRLCQIS